MWHDFKYYDELEGRGKQKVVFFLHFPAFDFFLATIL